MDKETQAELLSYEEVLQQDLTYNEELRVNITKRVNQILDEELLKREQFFRSRFLKII